MAQRILDFTVIGGYRFAESFSLQQQDPFVFAQAGQLTGSWQWTIDGRTANTHVNGATANRVRGGADNELFGTMQIDMFEFEESTRGSDLLYLAYRSSVFTQADPTLTIKVEGEFIGGTGKYAGARGHLTVTSVNGFFSDGVGQIVLPENGSGEVAAVDEATVRQWTEEYFAATQTGNPEVWADKFATNVYINDPYGGPIPTSREEVLGIGETFMQSFTEVGLYPDFIYVDGLTVRVKWTGRGTRKDGVRVTFQGINESRYNYYGKIISHIGYWNPELMTEVD